MFRRLFPFAVAVLSVSAACGKARETRGEPAVAAASCTHCHGGVDNGTGAPPRDTAGRTDTTLRSVGAHTAHVAAGPLAKAIDCSECHVKPTSPETHAPAGSPKLRWGAVATAGGATAPTFDGARCSNVYCHGAFQGGNASNAPDWTKVGQGGAACGSCHALPPAAPHPPRTDCGACHGAGYSLTTVNVATHVDGNVDLPGVTCTTCHGDATKTATPANPLFAAPPVDTHGSSDPASPGVGAHQAHLHDSPLRNALLCSDCHKVPSTVAHPNGQVDFAWSALATESGLITPSFSGGNCSNVYCHGAAPFAGETDHGGTNHTPSWTGGPAEAACGTCHGVPPAGSHPQRTDCGACHGAGYSATTVDPAKHVNGTLDLNGLTCTSCHGDPSQTATTLAPLFAAPPLDTHGNATSTSPGVGAHQAHLRDGALRTALPCTECHQVPTSTSHSTGTTVFAWGPLATAKSTTSPSYANGTCAATYCHGAVPIAGEADHGGTNHAPAWTGGSGEVACGTCHAVPPPAPHPQNPNCGGCHGTGYSSTTVNTSLHVNGQLDLGAMSCTSCHGDGTKSATSADPLWAAPPVDTHGNTQTTAPGVGAHQAHVQTGALRSAMACSDCHTVPQSLVGHPTGTTVFTWSALATGNGATTPTFDGTTCSSTYCHGSTLNHGGTNHAPTWTGGPAQAACGTCHGAPPPAPHPQTTACGGCHPGYGTLTVNPGNTTHVNGMLDLGTMTCTSCHGDSTQQASPASPLAAAPPVDTTGSSDPSSPGVGAHQAHLQTGALRVAMACTDCHVVPTSIATHPTGTVIFGWSALATANGTTSPSFSGGTCSATYCHGSTLNHGGLNHTPSWTGGSGQAACGTCHGVPPPSPHPQNISCGSCHGTGYSSTTVDKTKHVNGQLDVANLTCTSCHGNPTQTATPAAPLWAAPPVDTNGNAVSVHVGAHQTHLQGSALSSALPCTSCHTVPAGFAGHPTGTLDLTWSAVATGAATAALNANNTGFQSLYLSLSNFSVTIPSYSGGSWSAIYCHGNYSGSFEYQPVGTVSGVDPTATVNYVGLAASPSWSGTASCGSCHGIPGLPTCSPSVGPPCNPPAYTPAGWWHSGSHGNLAALSDCDTCHPDAQGNGATATITNAALHADGKVDLFPNFTNSSCRCHTGG